MEIPAAVLRSAGVSAVERRLPSREARSWLVWQGRTPAVARRLDPVLWPVGQADAHAELEWLHGFLQRLTRAGFPAPRPLPLLEEASWTVADGALWELMSYLPGEVIGWRPEVGLDQVGALLARLHQVSASIPAGEQRPRSWPLDRIASTRVPGELGGWLDELADDLRRVGHHRADRIVIHGDFTTHNVVASGQPPAPAGVIDFALAYREAPLADLGFGLWRSGRPYQDAIGLDFSRVGAMVTGYTRIRPIPVASAESIAVYIRARGVQQAIKALASGRPRDPVRSRRIRWLASHQRDITEAISAAISDA